MLTNHERTVASFTAKTYLYMGRTLYHLGWRSVSCRPLILRPVRTLLERKWPNRNCADETAFLSCWCVWLACSIKLWVAQPTLFFFKYKYDATTAVLDSFSRARSFHKRAHFANSQYPSDLHAFSPVPAGAPRRSHFSAEPVDTCLLYTSPSPRD